MSRTTIMRDDVGLFTGPPSAPLYTALEAVVAAAGADPVRVVVAGPLTASTNLSVPANVTLEFTGEGAIQVASGQTVNILGHVFAPAQQIFTGLGSVAFSSDSCVIFPGWWGGGESGIRIGKLASDEVEVTVLTAGSVNASSLHADLLQATGIQTTQDIVAGGHVVAAQVYEGSLRVGSDRVAKAGDVMTGPLVLYGLPQAAMEAVPRGYVLSVFNSLKVLAEQTDSFGIIVVNGHDVIRAKDPMTVVSLVDGFGVTISRGAPFKIVDAPPIAFSFTDDEDDAIAIGDENALVLACNESPATSTIIASDQVPSSKKIVRVSGDGGAVDLTSDPQVSTGIFDGQPLLIVGNDDINTVKLDDGSGLALVGASSVVLGKGDCLALRWDLSDSLWREEYRANV